MDYCIYENWTIRPKKARIHISACSWCNKGRGVHHTGSDYNGRWSGPFGSISDVIKAAENTGYPVSLCKKCNPN